MLDRFENVHVQRFLSNGSVIWLNVCVLGRLLWLNEEQCDLVFDAAVDDGLPDEFRAMVAAHCNWLSSPFESDLTSARFVHPA